VLVGQFLSYRIDFGAIVKDVEEVSRHAGIKPGGYVGFRTQTKKV
jgi:hypothetical protein